MSATERAIVTPLFTALRERKIVATWTAPLAGAAYTMGIEMPVGGLILQTEAELAEACIVVMDPTCGDISFIFNETGNEWVGNLLTAEIMQLTENAG